MSWGSVQRRIPHLILKQQEPKAMAFRQTFDLIPKHGVGGLVRVVVREFQPKDLDQVIQVFRDGMLRTVEETHEHFCVWKAWATDGTNVDLPDIQNAYVKPGGNFFVAVRENTEGDEVVGIVGLERSIVNNREAKMRRMSVKEAYRRYGVGRVIVQVMEQWAAASGIGSVHLTTVDLTAGFYTSLGYKETHHSVHCQDPYFEIIHFVKHV